MNFNELKRLLTKAYLLYQDSWGYVDKAGNARSHQRDAIEIMQRLYHDRSISGAFRGKLGDTMSAMKAGAKGDPYAMQKAERMLAKIVYGVSKVDLTTDGGTTMNIKRQMAYHAYEYRRLKAMDAGGSEMPLSRIKSLKSEGRQIGKQLDHYEKLYRDAQSKFESILNELANIARKAKEPQIKEAANEAYRVVNNM